jgi:leucyl aminopeptidase
VQVDVREIAAAEADVDAVAWGIFEGEPPPPELADVAGAGDLEGAFKKTAVLRPERPALALVVGLGEREKFDPERARVVAALAVREAARFEAISLAWAAPNDGVAADIAAALVTGTVLASYSFNRFRSSQPEDEPEPKLESLTLLSAETVAGSAEAARIAAEAQNRARDLQNLPANIATPSFLAGRAEEIGAEHDAISVEVLGREEIAERGMGGLEAVSRGSAEEPAMIVLRYAGGGGGPKLGLVGKGVTFDTGGISLKPSASMQEMKMDMSGAAAVLEAVAAVAEQGLALEIVAVVPATENMPSGTATRPGDIITQYNGKTVEVNNTDAEGRLILADALAYCAELGAERIVDLATLTGAVLIALGSTYAALISNDDELAAAVEQAGLESGELAWRLPLHPEYKELTRGTVADLTNAAAKRKAGTIYAGSFLEEFVDGRPWAHLDIAGTSWDVGREYVGKGPTGFGVRLLIELAQALSPPR